MESGFSFSFQLMKEGIDFLCRNRLYFQTFESERSDRKISIFEKKIKSDPVYQCNGLNSPAKSTR